MPANPWDTGGDYYPNFIEQGYKGAIQGGAAGGLSYAPTDQEMLVMTLVIIAIIATAGIASAAAPGGAAAGGGAAGGAGAAGAAGGAGAAAGGTSAGAAAGAGVGGSVAGTAAAGATGTAAAGVGATAGGTVASGVVLSEVVVTAPAVAGAAGVSAGTIAAGAGAIAALTPNAVQLQVPESPNTGPPSVVPQQYSNTTYASADSLRAADVAEQLQIQESLFGPSGNASASSLAGAGTPSAVSSSLGRVLGTQAIAGTFNNLAEPSTPPRPVYDKTDGAKFRPESRLPNRTNRRSTVKPRTTRSTGTKAKLEKPGPTLPQNVHDALKDVGMTLPDALKKLPGHLDDFVARYPNMAGAVGSQAFFSQVDKLFSTYLKTGDVNRLDLYLLEEEERERARQDPTNPWEVSFGTSRTLPSSFDRFVVPQDATRTNYPYEQDKTLFRNPQDLTAFKRRTAEIARLRREALAALEKPFIVKVAEPLQPKDFFNPFRPDPSSPRKYFLDPEQQEEFDSIFGEPQPGSVYYDIALDGTIDLNKPNRIPQQAQLVPLSRLAMALRAARSVQAIVRAAPALLRDVELVRLVRTGGQFIRTNAAIGSGTPSAALAQEAQTGVLRTVTNQQTGAIKYQSHLEKTAQFCELLLRIYRTRNLTEYEQRYVFNLYSEATEALRFALGPNSRLPVASINVQSYRDVLKLLNRMPRLLP